jgi:hypothetical protein
LYLFEESGEEGYQAPLQADEAARCPCWEAEGSSSRHDESHKRHLT